MKRLGWSILVLLCAAFGYFVWPTPWIYSFSRPEADAMALRVNRFTGRAQILTSAGWLDVGP